MKCSLGISNFLEEFSAAAAAAAAKSLQSCLTLCDPIDGSPPGSIVPGNLQARTLEWDAISFSNAWKWKVKGKSLSCVCPSHSMVFYYFFALITEEGFLTSRCYSLELCIQIDISFIFSFAFHFFSQLFVRLPQTTILPFCISFSWEWSWSVPPIQCHEPLFIVLQALCLSDLILWIYLSLSMYNHKGFNLGHTWMV